MPQTESHKQAKAENIHNQRTRQAADLLSCSRDEPRSTVISANAFHQLTATDKSCSSPLGARSNSLSPIAGRRKSEAQIHKVPKGATLFYEQEIACHSLLLHYKGEGFTCDLSAREPLFGGSV